MIKSILLLTALLCSLACSAVRSTTNTSDATSGGSSSSESCTLTDNTTETSTENAYGCKLLTRDTSACEADRTAQGLSGFWLKFSCRVTLSVSGSTVTMTIDSQPDSTSWYFDTSDPCYEAATLSDRFANPNTISAQSIAVSVPLAPTTASSATATEGGTIGVAANGVSIFSNEAAPGDDIYEEAQTFDKCDGHPQNTGNYHYHTEPSTITNADEAFVGVMRDGFPIYGRYGHGTNTDVTGLDAAGGHTSTTVDSPTTAVYHYHVNLQTNGTDAQYFISAGFWSGSVGSCTGCN